MSHRPSTVASGNFASSRHHRPPSHAGALDLPPVHDNAHRSRSEARSSRRHARRPSSQCSSGSWWRREGSEVEHVGDGGDGRVRLRHRHERGSESGSERGSERHGIRSPPRSPTVASERPSVLSLEEYAQMPQPKFKSFVCTLCRKHSMVEGKSRGLCRTCQGTVRLMKGVSTRPQESWPCGRTLRGSKPDKRFQDTQTLSGLTTLTKETRKMLLKSDAERLDKPDWSDPIKLLNGAPPPFESFRTMNVANPRRKSVVRAGTPLSPEFQGMNASDWIQGKNFTSSTKKNQLSQTLNSKLAVSNVNAFASDNMKKDRFQTTETMDEFKFKEGDDEEEWTHHRLRDHVSNFQEHRLRMIEWVRGMEKIRR